MTEAEWLTCASPKDMLEWLARNWRRRFTRWCGLSASFSTRRKLRLFAGACCVRSTQGVTIPHWDDELRNLVALGNGEIEVEQFEIFLGHERHASVAPETWALWRAESAGKHRGIKVAWDAVNHEIVTGESKGLDWNNVISEWAEERKAQCDCLRDIYGPLPFRAVTVDPSWLTWNDGTVVKLVQAIYDDRAFDRLPILADALEESGCDNADILTHCRGPGPHVRGCWAVGLILGKE
ncbi:MAG TPA: hypothetical protein VH592_25160 [Gemmataceae bacterium]|jgi:hypothetical protein